MRAALIVAISLVMVTAARAQGAPPWTTALSMSRKAIGVGECNVIVLDLKGAPGAEWPRGPNGSRVSMADFDFAVTAPVAHAAVGKYDGANNFAVCACPKAPAGTIATVTATYPSQTIAPKVKVAGVSYKVSTSAPIIAGSSSGNQPGCDAATATTVVSTGSAKPWSVALQPPALLPIGTCGNLVFTLRDASGKEWPRAANGSRVSVTDFDLSVKAARGADVVGKSDGGGNYSVCACRSGKVGERATVMATYPAHTLAATARAPGIALVASASFKLSARHSSANPVGCVAAKAQRVPAVVK